MKEMIIKWGVAWVAVFLLSGCAAMEYPRAHSTPLKEGSYSFSYTADLRAVHLIKTEDGYWILTEPPPDAAFSYDEDDAMDISLLSFGGKGKDGGAAAEGIEDLPLTGRTSYVLLARELLFRLNEMAYNTKATPDQVMGMYGRILEVVQSVAEMEVKNIRHETKVHLNTGVSSDLDFRTGDEASVGGNAESRGREEGSSGWNDDSKE